MYIAIFPQVGVGMKRFLWLFKFGLQLSETKRLRVSKFFLVGKVLTQKCLKTNIVMGVIKDPWRPKVVVEAMTIGDNCILFSFNSEEEQRLVLKGNPWFFFLGNLFFLFFFF